MLYLLFFIIFRVYFSGVAIKSNISLLPFSSFEGVEAAHANIPAPRERALLMGECTIESNPARLAAEMHDPNTSVMLSQLIPLGLRLETAFTLSSSSFLGVGNRMGLGIMVLLALTGVAFFLLWGTATTFAS